MLSNEDRAKMAAFGWDPDNQALAATYQELSAKLEQKRIDKAEFARQMNVADNAQVVKIDPHLYLSDPDYRRKVEVQSAQREAQSQSRDHEHDRSR
jgi:hypothetical protein